MRADILTMTEHPDRSAEEIAYCHTGEGGNNVARSSLITPAHCSGSTSRRIGRTRASGRRRGHLSFTRS